MKVGEVTVKVNVELNEDTKEQIRKIVREEIAAHMERPEVVSSKLEVDGEALANILAEHLRERRESRGETGLGDTL